MATQTWDLSTFRSGLFAHDAQRIVELWNRAAQDLHGFFPLTRSLFVRRIVRAACFRPEHLLVARVGPRIVGMLHRHTVEEPYYTPAGVVEMVLVDPDFRRQGLADALLAETLACFVAEGVSLVDGFGSWPYSPFYATLIDGSERSGVFLDCKGLLRLFLKHGFRRTRESLLMRCSLADNLPPLPERLAPHLAKTNVHWTCRQSPDTWLDFVFRGWRLYEHALTDPRGVLLSRAITARMDGLSDHTRREFRAVFGVNTPETLRGRGWATLNLHQLLTRLRADGAAEAELHVYADNEPAVRLYRRLGFETVARTVALRWTGGNPVA